MSYGANRLAGRRRPGTTPEPLAVAGVGDSGTDGLLFKAVWGGPARRPAVAYRSAGAPRGRRRKRQ